MALLAIETATQQLGVAVWDGGRVLSSYELLAEYPHAVELPGAVKRVLEAAHLRLNQLEAIAIDLGPGSFTGLRIGMAFAKALAFTQQRPLVGVASLDVLAAQLVRTHATVVPILDAKRQNVYAAFYRIEEEAPVRQGDYLLAPIQGVLERVSGPTLFVGDACPLYREQISAKLPAAQFAPADCWWPRVGALARLAAARLAKGQGDDPAAVVPLYLYARTCQVRLSDRPAGAPRKALAKPV